MLRINQNISASHAKTYFTTADYYTESQELVGLWRGEGAKRLGLSGIVQQKDWDALCDNKNPSTGKVLTQRLKQLRRVGYDFNFHVPKSVSLLYSLTKDDRILDAFRESVDATVRDIECEMKTRVRRSGKNENRTTANIVAGEYIHFTARPVKGIADPHLHCHVFIFNTTWDEVERRWKAGQFCDLKRDGSYFEAAFHSRLARRLEELGLPVERTKQGWELAGVAKQTLKKFSRRTALIEEIARKEGITDAKAKSELGAKTRERKCKDMTFDELREVWESRLSADESDAFKAVNSRLGGKAIAENDRGAGEAVIRAVSHCFERNAVIPERKLLTDALRRSFGAASLATVKQKLDRQDLITGNREGRRLVTTREVLEQERQMICFARNGRGTCLRLGDDSYIIKRDWLNDGQRKAVLHVLNSSDQVILVSGKAGTGKTKTMQETVEAIEANGKRVFTFAPSATASRGVLREEGFKDSETVSRLLVDPQIQEAAREQVIWIDESGLLSSHTMSQIFDLAERIGARVILSGDRFQHSSVDQGSPLRLLEEEAGLVPAEIREIKRQKGEYKAAVQALSDGRTEAGFRQLDKLGWVKEIPDGDRYKVLAKDYINTIKEKKTALVVSPTHLEMEWINDEIRSQLKQSGRLGQGERQVLMLENANLTEADRQDPVNYTETDSVLVFHQNAKGFKKGERVVVGNDSLPVSETAKFQVYHPGVLPVAPGDLMRITRNGTTVDKKHRLSNGDTFTVKRFDANGNIVFTNGWSIPRDFGFLAYGYCTTSHASQGRTVDRVFVGQSSHSYGASSREQFYVSCSRARDQVQIYCDDKHSLLEAVRYSDERLTATEFVSGRELRDRATTLQRMERMQPANLAQPVRGRVIYER